MLVQAAPAVPESSKAAIQQLTMELQGERCLNRLGQRLNANVSARLAAAGETLTTPICQSEWQLEQILVDELSNGLFGGWAAVLRRTETADDRVSSPEQPEPCFTESCFTVCAIAPQYAKPALDEACLATTAALMPFALGQSLRAGDLQRWRTQFPACSWQMYRDQSVWGWLLVSPMPAAAQPEAPSIVEPFTARLKTRLVEQSLDRYLAALHQMELIHTQAQQRQALAATNRELKQANHLKSEFLANTSHEIRTPLSSILGFTHLMREQGFSPNRVKHQEYLNIILSSGQHLLALLNDILDLSKIEANQLDLHWETVAVTAVCQTAITLVKEKANDKGLTLTLEIAPQLETLTADALRLKQMLFNLLSNALKFTTKGGVGLQVTAIDHRLHFTVWDTGMGISETQQQLLFRPYSQIANAATAQEEGTGLGLALTQKLAELHGGWVEVCSQQGQGSRFTIVLPLTPPHLEATAPQRVTITAIPSNEVQEEPEHVESAGVEPVFTIAQPDLNVSPSLHPSAVKPGAGSSKPIAGSRSNHLLLVEDNFYNAKLILTYLSKRGYELTWVKDGIEMRQALERALPALILMDVNLPGEDGLSLTQQLKADERYQAIPIVAQTAMAMTGDRDLCLEAGTVEYLSKPVDLQALAGIVSRYVQLKEPDRT